MADRLTRLRLRLFHRSIPLRSHPPRAIPITIPVVPGMRYGRTKTVINPDVAASVASRNASPASIAADLGVDVALVYTWLSRIRRGVMKVPTAPCDCDDEGPCLIHFQDGTWQRRRACPTE